MKILAFECSAKQASVAIAEDEKILTEFYSNVGLTHSQTLMPMMEAALTACGLKIDDIDGVCIAAGPGSFTGLRIGMSAVKGLTLGSEKPCVGVSTLFAMAHCNLAFKGVIAACMDARCNQCYCGLFLSNGENITRITEDMAIPMEEFCYLVNAKSEELKLPVLIMGDGANLFNKGFGDKLKNAVMAPDGSRYQSARGVVAAALNDFNSGNTVSSAELLPIYLRLPQAERELKKKMEEQK